MNETLKEIDSKALFEDDDLENQEEEEFEDDFDFEGWDEYCREREVEADSQRHLDWLYNTRGN